MFFFLKNFEINDEILKKILKKMLQTFNFLAPFALGRLAADSEEDSRIWTPDVTEIVEINLVEGVSQTYAIDTSNSGAYWPNQYIRINVNAPEGFKIRQSFNYFQTEGVGLTGVCDNDAALIFDGKTTIFSVSNSILRTRRKQSRKFRVSMRQYGSGLHFH